MAMSKKSLFGPLFLVKLLNYVDKNANILRKRQYLTLLVVIFTPKNFLILRILAVPLGKEQNLLTFQF